MTDRPANDELELRHYVGVLWRRRLTVAIVTILFVGLALAYSFNQQPLYHAHADVLLAQSVAETLTQVDNSNNVTAGKGNNGAIDTEIAIMKSRSVIAAVQTKLGITSGLKVSLAQVQDTTVVAVTATNPDPDQAAKIAETYAETYISQRRTALINNYLQTGAQIQAQITALQTQLAAVQKPLQDLQARIAAAPNLTIQKELQDQLNSLQTQSQQQIASLNSQITSYNSQLQGLQIASNITQNATGGAQVISPAVASRQPFTPKPIRNGVAGGLVGLILGIALGFLRDHYDDTMKGKDDLEASAPGLPVLGLIPAVQGWKNRSNTMLISEIDPNSAPAEAYRTLRTSLQFSSLEGEIGVVQVTSPQPGDGKTTTVVNLAVALAKAGLRVVVVDCDLRRPRMHDFFGLDHSTGLTTVLLGEATLAEAVQRVDGPLPLAVLASGEVPPNPSEVLSSPGIGAVLERLREEADFVLVDSPPVLPVADALILAANADAVAMVATAGKTSRRDFKRAIELLDGVEAPLIGTILNSVEDDRGMGYGYGYGYQPYAKKPETKPKKGKAPKRRGRAAPAPSSSNGKAGTNGHKPVDVRDGEPVITTSSASRPE